MTLLPGENWNGVTLSRLPRRPRRSRGRPVGAPLRAAEESRQPPADPSKHLLFFDEHMVLGMKNVEFAINRAVKAPRNPVIRGDRPWEGKTIAEVTVVYDEEQKLFRMWYPVYDYHPPIPPAGTPADGKIADLVEERKRCTACYAISKDGHHWEKPNLGLVEFQGSRQNNIIMASSLESRTHFATGHVFRDPIETDPAKRYKGMKPRMLRGRMVIDLYFSPTGVKWTPYERNPVFDLNKPGSWGPTSYMGWDPIRKVYAVYMENCGHQKCPDGKRLIGRAESPDMIHWSEPDTILVPDDRDGPYVQPYALHPTTYREFYIGLLWSHNVRLQNHHPQFVFSRDGSRFDRRYRDSFIERGTGAEFDSNNLLPIKPIVRGDEIFLFYLAANYRSPEQFDALGKEKAEMSIGLAVVQRDRFVCIQPTKGNTGEVVTRSMRPSGKKLILNMQIAEGRNGEVKVEIMDPAHWPVSGFALGDADPLTKSGLDITATWKGSDNIGSVAGKPIKLRISLKNAQLFSVRFSD